MSSADWNLKPFMQGASILAVSAVLVRVLGAIYRVPFQNLVGDKGFYIYQQVYPFIGIFIVWASYGFAVAVSKLLASSESLDEKNATRRIAFFYLTLVSLVFFIGLTVLAPFFARSMGDMELAPLLRAGAYIVLVMPALAVLKGSFQAEGSMVPVAVSNVGEQAVRVCIILVGTWIALHAGASLYTTGTIAMWSGVVGQAAGVAILAFYSRKLFQGPSIRIKPWPIVKELTVVSISVSASSLILLLFQLVDSFTVYNGLLANGFAEEAAMARKGVYDRGHPLVQMGILIATTLALAIVPLIAHHAPKEEGRGALPFIRLTFRTAFLFGWAAAAGLALVMPYVNEMLFETRDGSLTLIIFSFQIFWLSLILPLTAVLQGAGKVKIPTLLLAGGLVVKMVANYIGVPLFDVTGAALAGNIGLSAISFGLLLYFKKVWPIGLAPVRFYGWIVVATVLMAVIIVPWMILGDSVLVDNLPSRVGSALIALSSVALGAAVFLSVVMKSRIMAEKDWYLLPFGKRLAVIQLWLNKNRR